MQALIDRFVAWAEPRSDLRAALVVGSYARRDHPADVWSDLDLLLITTDPHFYLERTDWLTDVGQPWLTFLEPTAVGRLVERRVLFAGALDVDFTVVPLAVVQQLSSTRCPGGGGAGISAWDAGIV